MSVTDNDAWQQVTIDGDLDTEHVLDFPCLAATDLVVIRDRSDVISTLVKDTDYTVSLSGAYIPTVTLSATPTEGDVISFYRNEAIARSATFAALGDFTPVAIETALDAITRQMQQLERDVANAIRIPKQDYAQSTELAKAATRAGKTLGFDETTGAPTLQDASGSSYGWQYVEKVEVSSDVTVEFDDLTTYDQYRIRMIGVTVGTDADRVILKLSTDNGATFLGADYTSLAYGRAGSSSINANITSAIYLTDSSTDGVGNASGEHLNGEVTLRDPKGTSVFQAVDVDLTYIAADGDPAWMKIAAFYIGALTAIDAVQFSTAAAGGSVGFSAGTFILEGRNLP